MGLEHSFLFMTVCMVLAGLMTTMNTWIDKWDDFYFSLNDLYMIGLMTSWMFVFMGLFSLNFVRFFWGALFAVIFFALIRTQAFVTEIQYLRGMIPHHSMAVMMSKRLEKKPNSIQHLLDQIIQGQEKEIVIMKHFL